MLILIDYQQEAQLEIQFRLIGQRIFVHIFFFNFVQLLDRKFSIVEILRKNFENKKAKTPLKIDYLNEPYGDGPIKAQQCGRKMTIFINLNN